MEANEILTQAENIHKMYQAGEISKDEFAELLEDLKRTTAIEEMSDDVELKSTIIKVLDIASYAL